MLLFFFGVPSPPLKYKFASIKLIFDSRNCIAPTIAMVCIAIL